MTNDQEVTPQDMHASLNRHWDAATKDLDPESLRFGISALGVESEEGINMSSMLVGSPHTLGQAIANLVFGVRESMPLLAVAFFQHYLALMAEKGSAAESETAKSLFDTIFLGNSEHETRH